MGINVSMKAYDVKCYTLMHHQRLIDMQNLNFMIPFFDLFAENHLRCWKIIFFSSFSSIKRFITMSFSFVSRANNIFRRDKYQVTLFEVIKSSISNRFDRYKCKHEKEKNEYFKLNKISFTMALDLKDVIMDGR